MDWHDFITMRGAEAVAIAAICASIAAAWRWAVRKVRRVRAKTREAFAKSIGTHTAAAMEPVVERMDARVAAVETQVSAMRQEWDDRRVEDDARWAKTEGLYDRLHEHMDAEERRGNDG